MLSMILLDVPTIEKFCNWDREGLFNSITYNSCRANTRKGLTTFNIVVKITFEHHSKFDSVTEVPYEEYLHVRTCIVSCICSVLDCK